MPAKQQHPGRDSQRRLVRSLAALRTELEIREDFPEHVLREAAASVLGHEPPAEDLRGLPFLTIDPPGSTDLDQAIHLARRRTATGSPSPPATTSASGEDGYEVRYAIADVPGFVQAEGAVDAEARLRGQTLYLPEGRIPLHPGVIGDAAASLLPAQDRAAFVWHFQLDAAAVVRSVSVRRATIRSCRQLTYAQVQDALDDGTADDELRLLEEIGRARIRLEIERGGAGLTLPRREIVHDDDSGYRIRAEAALPCEHFNAQLSLMTGMAAARIMIDGGVGILRTMPGPDEGALRKFRRQASSLGHPWPEELSYGAFLRSLDVTDPQQLAIMHAAATLFRGAGYTSFDGRVPEDVVQSAIAAPYAHATAPIRRLVDRFVLVICAALCAGEAVPAWVRRALPDLDAVMTSSAHTASRLESGTMDAVQAALLEGRIGEAFSAVVLQGSPPAADDVPGKQAPRSSGVVQVTGLDLEAICYGELVAGQRVTVILLEADVDRRRLRFEVKPADAPPTRAAQCRDDARSGRAG